MAAKLEPELRASKDVAIEQAKLAFDVLWGTVVPSFNEIKDAPVGKNFSAKPLPDGGFEVSGNFKGGMLSFLGIGSEGKFSVKIDEAGQVDPKSVSIDLGPKFAKYAGAKALEMWSKDTGLGKKVSGATVDDRMGADGRYTVRASIGSSMRGSVEVSGMGLVAWDTMKTA